MRVCFTNLGCKLNQAELEGLAREFHLAGHRVVSSLEEADLHVVNSCTVTHRAARDSRKVARRGSRRKPGVKTVLTGCYATDSPAEAVRLAGVDLVVPNREKEGLLARVHEAFPDARPGGAEGHPEAPAAPGSGAEPYGSLAFGNTRALVKVEDGCNVGCSFCIIPHTRGRQASRPVPEIVDEVRGMAEAGVREVVVTGVQISHYRWQGRGLADLVEALLEGTAIPRIRLTSIAPWSFDRRLLALFREERLCRHVHMSLQSGCDATLRRMRRPYTARDYAERVEELRAEVPGVAVTTDVIVGFPGETGEEFEASRRFVEARRFARTHVFSYSPREGTEAAGLPDPLPPETIKARTAEMIATAATGERAFREAHRGRRISVLWEERRRGAWKGLTDNYLRAEAPVATGGEEAGPRPRDLGNTITPARVVDLTDDGVLVRVEPPGGPHGAAGPSGEERARSETASGVGAP